MREVHYRQCGLKQGNAQVVGWIEERGAHVGARVEIEELGGFWEVIGVGSTSLAKADVHKKEAQARQSFSALKAYRKKDS